MRVMDSTRLGNGNQQGRVCNQPCGYPCVHSSDCAPGIPADLQTHRRARPLQHYRLQACQTGKAVEEERIGVPAQFLPSGC